MTASRVNRSAATLPAQPATAVDATRVGARVLRGSREPGQRGMPMRLYEGLTHIPGVEAVVNFGRARSVSEPRAVDPSSGDPDVRALRAGRRFQRQSAEVATHGGLGSFYPAGPLGYGYGGVRRRGVASVESVRLPTARGPVRVPGTANELRTGLSAGESVTVTQQRDTGLFAGTLLAKIDHDFPDHSWLVGSPIGLYTSIAKRGVTSTEIVRAERDSALITVSTQRDKARDGTGGFDLGFIFGWPVSVGIEVARRLTGASKRARDMVDMPIWRELLFSGHAGRGGRTGEARLARYRLDLRHPDAERAYRAMLAGDLDTVRKLAAQAGSPVSVDFAAESEIREKLIPVAFGLTGIGVSWAKEKGRRVTTARIGHEQLERITHRRGTRRKNQRLARKVETAVSAERIEGGGSALVYSRDVKDRFTSREEVLAELQFAGQLLGPHAPAALAQVGAKVARLAPKRLARIGPRREAGSTHIEIDVRLPQAAIERLVALPPPVLQNALGDARVVRKLRELRARPAEDRADTLRKLIGSGGAGRKRLIGIARALKYDGLEVAIDIGSAPSRKGPGLEFSHRTEPPTGYAPTLESIEQRLSTDS